MVYPAPQYLQSYCESTSTCTGRRHLRSSQMSQLVVPTTRTKYGSVCDFLLVRNSNLGSILHRFGDQTGFMCFWPHPYSTLILRVFPLHQIARVGRKRAHGP